MSRFVIRYRGSGARPEDVVRRIRQMPELSIVDDGGRVLLVEGPEGSLREALGSSTDWLVAAEKTYSVPSPRKRIERPPSDT